MAVRKDQVQISIQFLTDENRQYAKTINDTDKLLSKMKQVQKSGGDIGDVLNDIANEASKISKIDLSSLTPSQLITRSRQLAQAMKLIPQSAPQFKVLETEQKRVNDRLAEMRSRTRGVSAAMDKARNETNLWSRVLAGVSFIGLIQGARQFVTRLVNVNAETQKYNAVLTNTLGSQEAAKQAFELINEVTAQTPFQLEEVTDAYVRLVNRGFQPTREELISLTDLAASQGKSILQVSEALLDAGVGEFERLKELGIRAKANGDIVTLSFKDQTVEVARTEQAIQQAIVAFGQLEGVQGSTAAISRTLGGQISNLQDRISNFFRTIGENGGNRILTFFVSTISDLTQGITDLIEPAEAARRQFDEQLSTVQQVEQDLVPLIERYDELSSQSNLSEEAQKELSNVIEEIANIAPSAITQVDEYGKVLGISADEARAFADAQRENLQLVRELSIEETQKQIDVLRQQQEEYKQIVETGKEFVEEFFSLGSEQPISDERRRDVRRDLNETTKLLIEAERELLRLNNQQPGDAQSTQEDTVQDLGPSQQDIERASRQRKEARDNAFKSELEDLQTQSLAKQVILEQDFTNGLVSEQQYSDELLAIRRDLLTKQLKVISDAKGAESQEALSKQQQLLQIEREGAAAILSQNLEQIATAQTDRELALAENLSRQRITEEQFNEQILQVRRDGLRQQLAARYQAGEEETQAVIQLRQQLIQSEIDLRNLETDQRTQANQEALEQELADLEYFYEQRAIVIQELTLQGLLSEQEAKAQQDELKIEQVTQELEVLRANKDTEIELIRQKELEKRRIELEVGNERIDNEQRISEAKQKIEQQSLAATSSFFSSLAALLKATGKEGKNYVQFIKAIEVASVIAKGISEIQSIYATAAASGNPAYAIIANIQAVAAGLRTAAAVANINKVKAARGKAMKFGRFSGKLHSSGGTKGIFEDGTQIEVEKDEIFAVVNRRNSNLIRQLSDLNSYGGNGDPFFERGGLMKFQNGGLTTVNTTPQPIPITDNQQQGSAALDRQTELFEEINQGIRNFPRQLRAYTVYEDIEDSSTEINEVREAAAF